MPGIALVLALLGRSLLEADDLIFGQIGGEELGKLDIFRLLLLWLSKYNVALGLNRASRSTVCYNLHKDRQGESAQSA